jgi:hypothetical protein
MQDLHPFMTRVELVKYCQSKNIVLEAWAPLVRGERFDHPVIVELAKKYKKSPAQILIRYGLDSVSGALYTQISPAFRVLSLECRLRSYGSRSAGLHRHSEIDKEEPDRRQRQRVRLCPRQGRPRPPPHSGRVLGHRLGGFHRALKSTPGPRSFPLAADTQKKKKKMGFTTIV